LVGRKVGERGGREKGRLTSDRTFCADSARAAVCTADMAFGTSQVPQKIDDNLWAAGVGWLPTRRGTKFVVALLCCELRVWRAGGPAAMTKVAALRSDPESRR
jgi:hypothetical protein